MQAQRNTRRPATSRIAAVIAALAFGASASWAGPAPEVDLPSLTNAAQAGQGPLTREQVRAELMEARALGTTTQLGEAGDTAQVLAAREQFNSTQTERLVAHYQAEHDLKVAMIREEELRLALADLSQPQYSSADQSLIAPTDAGESEESVGIDVIRIDSHIASATPGNELVIVSIEGGDEYAQQERADAIRRQLGAMGLAPEQIYIESTLPQTVTTTEVEATVSEPVVQPEQPDQAVSADDSWRE